METALIKQLESSEMSSVVPPENATPVGMVPMTATEASSYIDALAGNLENSKAKLLELERRRGWKALGYSSWRDCAVAELGQSQAYLYRLLASARVEENLAQSLGATIVENFVETPIPVSQLSELAQLAPDKQAAGLVLAEQIAYREGKMRTALHVKRAVKQIKSFADTAVKPEIELAEEEVTPYLAHRAVNSAVKAERIVDAVVGCLGVGFVVCNHLEEQLLGKVFICPSTQINQWSKALLVAYQSGQVIEAVALLPLDSQCFKIFAPYALCPLPDSRVVVYLGTNLPKFIACFAEFGSTWRRL